MGHDVSATRELGQKQPHVLTVRRELQELKDAIQDIMDIKRTLRFIGP